MMLVEMARIEMTATVGLSWNPAVADDMRRGWDSASRIVE
jgi:hypothetical protein